MRIRLCARRGAFRVMCMLSKWKECIYSCLMALPWIGDANKFFISPYCYSVSTVDKRQSVFIIQLKCMMILSKEIFFPCQAFAWTNPKIEFRIVMLQSTDALYNSLGQRDPFGASCQFGLTPNSIYFLSNWWLFIRHFKHPFQR